MRSILIISSAEDQESTAINNEFVGALQQRLAGDCRIEWVNYHGLRVEVGVDTLRVCLQQDNRELREFDFVYFKSYFRNSEFAGVVATYLEQAQVPFVCSELKDHIALTKLTQFARMAVAGLPIVDTVFMLSSEFRSYFSALQEKFGVPFILKSIDGSGGDENFLVRSEAEFLAAFDAYPDLQFVAQPFIANDSDFRVLIVDSSIKLIIERRRGNDASHLNNTSQGGHAELVPLEALSDQDQALCVRAAQLMQRETAGVDLMYETGTGKPYILEVNASPQIGSGAFMQEKLAIFEAYFKDRIA